jgi:hypothetical protein
MPNESITLEGSTVVTEISGDAAVLQALEGEPLSTLMAYLRFTSKN